MEPTAFTIFVIIIDACSTSAMNYKHLSDKTYCSAFKPYNETKVWNTFPDIIICDILFLFHEVLS